MDIEQLNFKYNFTETEKNILEFLYNSKDYNYNPTIRETAKECFTSPTTIIKLAKKMNLSGYTELLLKIKETPSLSLASPSNSFISKLPSIEVEKQFIDILNKFQNKNILIVASGFSQVIGDYMNDSFLLSNLRSITNIHLELFSLENAKKTLLIVVSESGETSLIKEIVDIAKKNGVTIISFTGNPLSTISKKSDLDISVSFFDILSNGTNPKYFYGSTLIVFEYLMSSYKRSLH